MKNIKRKYNLMVDLSKFTSNKNVLNKVVKVTTNFVEFFFNLKNI